MTLDDLELLLLLFFIITPKAAHNRLQHNQKHKGKNIHKHTKIIKPNEQQSPRLHVFDDTV